MTERDLLAAETALFEESRRVTAANALGEARDLRRLIELARTYWEVAQDLLRQEIEADEDEASAVPE